MPRYTVILLLFIRKITNINIFAAFLVIVLLSFFKCKTWFFMLLLRLCKNWNGKWFVFAGQKSTTEIVDIEECRRDSCEEGWKEGHGVWSRSEPWSWCQGKLQGWSSNSFSTIQEMDNTHDKKCWTWVLTASSRLNSFNTINRSINWRTIRWFIIQMIDQILKHLQIVHNQDTCVYIIWRRKTIRISTSNCFYFFSVDVFIL